MAMTGYYRTLVRPRAHRPLSMLKYDPVGMSSLSPSLSLVRALFGGRMRGLEGRKREKEKEGEGEKRAGRGKGREGGDG